MEQERRQTPKEGGSQAGTERERERERYTRTHTDAHGRTQTHTDAHGRTRTHTDAHTHVHTHRRRQVSGYEHTGKDLGSRLQRVKVLVSYRDDRAIWIDGVHKSVLVCVIYKLERPCDDCVLTQDQV